MEKNATFSGANKLATAVGATGLKPEIVVPQPRVLIPVIKEVEFEFDQEKFEAYLSASSNSSTPRKAKKPSAARRTRMASPTEADVRRAAANNNDGNKFPAPSPNGARSDLPPPTNEEKSAEGVVTLSKRARQRRRQRLALQYAKALESKDGIHYKPDPESRRGHEPHKTKIGGNSSKPPTDEWIRVRRNRSTLKERIQKRRALRARARALVQAAQRPKEEQVAKKSSEARRAQLPKVRAPVSSQPASAPKIPANTAPLSDKGSVFQRLGPVQKDRGERSTPAGSLKRSRTTLDAGGSPRPSKEKATKNPPTGLRIEVRKPAETPHSQKRALWRVTFRDFETPPQPQTETSSSDDDVIPEGSCHRTAGCSGLGANELYYRVGGRKKSRRQSSPEANSSCLCSKLIKAVLSECKCCRETPERVSVFQRLTTETPRSRSRRSHRRLTPRLGDELPEVTINVTNKATPSRGIPGSSQRITRLRAGTIKRPNYHNLQRGIPTGHNLRQRVSSEDEVSDASSALASDNTMSSEGRPREALMISAAEMAKILEEALAKQKESFQLEMQMAMQQMKEFQNKQILTLLNRRGESSRRNNDDQTDSDAEGDEHPNADDTPNEQNVSDDTGIPPQNHRNKDVGENEKIKDLESKINTLISAQEVKKTGIPCPYPREWESIPYPAKFNLINFTPFDGRGSPTQHLIYFKSHLGVISGNEPLMVRSFVGTLRGAAFDWYRRLKTDSINSWDDMESMFLANFFDDDTEISIGALLEEKQKNGETVDAFIKRFRNKALNCRDPITEEFILQTCYNNLSLDVLEAMGITPSKTWKDLKVRGEQAERFLKRKKVERSQQVTNADKQSFATRSKRKERAKIVEANQTLYKPKSSEPRFPKTYSFRDDEVPGIFKYLLENNKIQLPPIANQEEAKMVTDPKYCAYHRAVHHPTRACYQLKDKIQALIEVGVITPKPKK